MKDSSGKVRGFGTRYHYCKNSEDYWEQTKRIVEAITERYGHNDNVVAWQIDNEFGGSDTVRCYSRFRTRDTNRQINERGSRIIMTSPSTSCEEARP